MGFKIKNSLTGEFEKLPILTLKGEKGETGGVEEYNKVDYMGNKYETLKQVNDANVEYAVKTAIGEFNYLDYDGQHITATDTIEGQSKSAILKGQTLVNMFGNSRKTTTPTSLYWNVGSSILNVKPNTKYFVKIKSNYRLDFKYRTPNQTIKEITDTNSQTFTFTSSSDTDIVLITRETDVEYVVDVIMLEYQEGMENWDIPYFEGMQSVKMPVLTTVGKNLFDYNNLNTSIDTRHVVQNGATFYCKTTSVKVIGFKGLDSEKTYTISFDLLKSKNASTSANSLAYAISKYDENYTHPDRCLSVKVNNSFITDVLQRVSFTASGVELLSIQGGVGYTFSNIQIEEGSIATPYEPHKSNILSTPEDLELRGIGDVKDTLNCLTGELTQRIGEDVLDGSQGLTITGTPNQENTLCVLFPDFPKIGNGVVMSDELIKASNYDYSDTECITQNAFGIAIRLLRNRLESADINGVKKFLSQNPITVQYQLETESVKTVDLSDNHVYSYKGTTHYDCSSTEGSLVPTLSVKVPTDVQATIAQQRETIQTLNSENERLNQIQEALKASMLDSQVQLMNLSWDTDFEVFTLRESIAPKDSLMDSKTGSNIDKFSQAKFIIENDCPDLEKLNSQIEYYFSKDVFSQEQFEELTDLISIVKGENGCEY